MASATVDSVEELVDLKIRDMDELRAVTEMVHKFADRPASGPSGYRLDLKDLTGLHNGSRVDARWGAMLTNLLMQSEFQEARVELLPPEFSAARTQLARVGMMYALARHPDLSVISDSDGFRELCGTWRRDWVPVRPDLTLFDFGSEGTQPTSVADKVVAFVNPRESRIEVNARRNAIFPWLHDYLGAATGGTTMEVLDSLSSVTTELIDNIQEHASTNDGLLTISEVGHSPSDRGSVQLVAIDSGCGIPSSVLAREPEVDPAVRLAEYLNGESTSRAGGRGRGLQRIVEVVREYNGRLTIASGPDSEGETLFVDHQFSDNAENILVSCRPDFGIRGTVVVLRLTQRSLVR